MSEIGWALIVYLNDSKRLSNTATVGKVSPGLECKVIDENECVLGPNVLGQLCFRGDQVDFRIYFIKFWLGGYIYASRAYYYVYP